MPTYNRAHTIEKSIKSVILQTYKNWELIIIDDGSTDNTEKNIDNFNENRIKYHKLQKNCGAQFARKRGINLSKGEFIAFLDSDDIYHKTKLEKQINLFFKIKSPVILCDYWEVRKNQRIKHLLSDYSGNKSNQILKCPGPLFQCMFIHKKKVPNLEKYIDEKLISSQEWDFAIQLFMNHKIFSNVNEALVSWRIQDDSISKNPKISAIGCQTIVEKYEKNILDQVGKNVLSDHYRRIARLWEEANDLKTAKKFYKKAFIASPFYPKNIIHFILTMLCYPKLVLKLLIMVRKMREVNNEQKQTNNHSIPR